MSKLLTGGEVWGVRI